MNRLGALFLVLFSAALGFSDVQENTTFRNLTIVTGTFGNTVNYCNSTIHCGSYSCFPDYDSSSSDNYQGYCRPSSNTDCPHNGSWNSTGTDAAACKNDTYKWSCSSGTWSATACSGSCSSGVCSSAAPTPTSSSGGGGGSSNTTPTPTRTPTPTPLPMLKITSSIESFNLTQGESAAKSATVKNDGNTTVYNATVSLTGIESSWYNITPAKFDTIANGDSKTFVINITTPKSAEVKDYAVKYSVSADAAKISSEFTLRLLPSEETVEEELMPLYENQTKILKGLENEITRLETEGANVDELRKLMGDIKSKINATGSSIENENYFEAAQSLRDAENLIKDLRLKIESTAIPQKELPIIPILVLVAIGIVGGLAYLLWPVQTGFKPKKGWVMREETAQEKIKQKIRDVIAKIKEKIESRLGAKYKYQYKNL